MKKTLITTTMVLATLYASPAEAQERWGLEIRANGAMATQEIGSEDLQGGFGFEGTLRYRVQPHLALYAGWDWIRFGAADAFAGPDMDLEETGYVVGLRFEHPFHGEAGRTGWWVRGGATYDHLELENGDGDLVADSGHGWGWEAGAGVALPVGARWSFTPGVRFRSLSRDVVVGSATTPVELRYVAFEVGFARVF